MTFPLSVTRNFMLAGQASLLQNQQLCGYLQTMDQEELGQIAREDTTLSNEVAELNQAYSWRNLLKDGCLAGLGLGAVAGGSKYAYDHSRWAEIPSDHASEYWRTFRHLVGQVSNTLSPSEINAKAMEAEKRYIEQHRKLEQERLAQSPKDSAKWFVISSLVVGCAVVSVELYNYYSHRNGLLKHHTLTVNDHRYGRLQNKIREVQRRLEGNGDQIELRQLPIAKNYFEKKLLDMNLDLRNNITLTMVHHHVQSRYN
jgi:hypothetical protein